MKRAREFLEYNIRPVVDLLLQREFGFLSGAILEKFLRGWNPYFWYRDWRDKDQIVTRHVRGHEMLLDLYDRGISRHLFIRGVHERDAAEAYREALAMANDETEGETTVLDIGANIGYYVLEEADVLGDRARIIAFEPDPKNRRLLEQNVERNEYDDRVEISPLAVDKQSGERTFCRSTHSNWNRLEQGEKTGNVDELVERFTVETTSVDGFLTEAHIEPETVNAVRMDLEGHELNVLRGMTDVLSADGPLVLFIEFHPDFGNRKEYEAAISTLEQHEFDVQHVSQEWNVIENESFEELRSIEGSHVRVVARK